MASVPDKDKKTEAIRVYVSEPLELALRRLADDNDRSLSEYIALVLKRHVYGHGKCGQPEGEGTDKAE